MKKFAIALVVMLATVVGAQERRHWQLTDDETIWIGRYSNCQYGYYSLLPSGVVAHAEHPPAPHHGFVINLPDVTVKTEVTFDNSDRLVWVNAEYNVTEESTLAGVSDYQIDLTSRNKEGFKLVEQSPAMLRGVPATRFKVEYETPKGRVIEEEVVVLKSGVVYELGLKTLAVDYLADRNRLEQTLAGFRFIRVPKGQCWNK
jgi:hypothetical protein